MLCLSLWVCTGTWICIQLKPSRSSRACRKRRLKKGRGFFAWPRGKESDCNSLCYSHTVLKSSTTTNHSKRGKQGDKEFRLLLDLLLGSHCGSLNQRAADTRRSHGDQAVVRPDWALTLSLCIPRWKDFMIPTEASDLDGTNVLCMHWLPMGQLG